MSEATSETQLDRAAAATNTPHGREELPGPHHERLLTEPRTTYVHLLRTARHLFSPAELSRLVPRTRGGPSLAEANGAGAAGLDPLAATEAIAHDFLCRGGKFARPFITLAAYDAIACDAKPRSRDACSPGEQRRRGIPDAVRRVALSIETFHKASLVHDDIEDGDEFRYGQPTLHRSHGLPTAVNLGDYLIGLGYRLVSQDCSLGAEATVEILDMLANAHLRLSEGQGAELLWRDARDKQLAPLDALKIYALKTAPAFEAALLSGVRCAAPLGELKRPLKHFAKYLGIAFQILNDLKDWQGDRNNKLSAGLDTLGGRPTVLWALALEGSRDVDRKELLELLESSADPTAKVARVRELYLAAGVFDSAGKLVAKYHSQAKQIALEIQPERLQRLLHYLVDTVLDSPARSENFLVSHKDR